MRKAVWIICKNEEFYIDMAIRSVIDWVDGIFILDTGSWDGTLDVIRDFAQRYPGKIVWEQKDFGSEQNFRFGRNYDEAVARNYPMDKALEIFNPDFLIQLDGDEVFTPTFFDIVDSVKMGCLAHSTDLPTSPGTVMSGMGDASGWNGGGAVLWKGIRLFDPHVRGWNTKYKVKWASRVGQDVIPRVYAPQPFPDYIEVPDRFITTEKIHFHLHRAFGPKSIVYHLTDFKLGYVAAAAKLGIPCSNVFNQDFLSQKYPKYFVNGKFKPHKELLGRLKGVSIPCDNLPSFVKEKWLGWGDWSDWDSV